MKRIIVSFILLLLIYYIIGNNKITTMIINTADSQNSAHFFQLELNFGFYIYILSSS